MAGKPVGTASADLPKAAPPKATKAAPKGRGGAPHGNVNHAKDPKFTKAMRAAQELAKRNRARRRRNRVNASEAMLAEAGLQDSPVAQRLGLRLAQLDHEIEECERITSRIGRVKRDGTLSPIYERYLTLTQNDRVELVKLVDRLAELRQSLPDAGSAHVMFRVRLPGGLAGDPNIYECPECTATWYELPDAVTGNAGRRFGPDPEGNPVDIPTTRPGTVNESSAPPTAVPPRSDALPCSAEGVDVSEPAPATEAPVARREPVPAFDAATRERAALQAVVATHQGGCGCYLCQNFRNTMN